MVVIDLLVNKDLLDIKFEGYKLSLNPIPVLKQPLIDGVKCVELDNDDYSYIQTRMNLQLNHLFQDPWNQNSIFYINAKSNVIWTSLGQDGRLSIPRRVFEVLPESQTQGNITISFPSADWACLCNGSDWIYILYTPSRIAGEPWMCYLEFDLQIKSPCYLLHAVHRSSPGGQQLDCVVATVEHKSKLPTDIFSTFNNPFVSLLEWISFSCGQNNQAWSVKRTRKLAGSSFPEYVAIDNIEDAICVVSQNEFELYFDSDGSICSTQFTKTKDSAKYVYVQTPDDITVYFRLPTDIKKTDVQINFEPLSLEVLIRGKCELSGQLDNCINCGASTWILDGDKLEVLLSKAEVGLMWRELVKDNKEGDELMNIALVEEIHAQLAHLTSDTEVTPSNKVPFNLEQLEECDTSIEHLTFQRIDGNKHEETHKINLGGHQWLFSEQINPENLPAICLRYDVDGILWQPKNISSEGELENFKMEHLTTFSALGYVSASKQDKKFTACSSDFQYAVISDCARHLYVYSQPESLHSALELRNRKTGESIAHIAKQYVISLEECDRMLGLRVSPQCIFVLSRDMLYAAKVASQ